MIFVREILRKFFINSL